MRPLAQLPIEGQVDEAFRVIELESWLDDELKCEQKHEKSTCSIEVTHATIYCKSHIRQCANAAEANRKVIREGRHHCAHCKRPARDCWTIRPI